MVAGRALDAGFFIVDIEMPRRIGIKHRIASVAWERSALVAGCGQPFDALGATHFSLTRSDLLCRPKDLPLAPRHDLALVLLRKHCHVSGSRDGDRALLNRMDQLRSAILLNFTGAGDAALADSEQLRASANWQTLAVLVVAELERRQLGRHHGALRFRQVPTPQV